MSTQGNKSLGSYYNPGDGFFWYEGRCSNIWDSDPEHGDRLEFKIIGKDGFFIEVAKFPRSSNENAQNEVLHALAFKNYFERPDLSDEDGVRFREDYRIRAIRGEIDPFETWRQITSPENLAKYEKPSGDSPKKAA